MTKVLHFFIVLFIILCNIIKTEVFAEISTGRKRDDNTV